MLRHTLLLALLAFVLSGCSGVSVNHDYSLEHDFSQYRTFQWHPLGPPRDEHLNLVGGDIFDTRLRRAISQTLAGKGISLGETPDFYVNYSVVTDERVSIQSFNTHTPYGYGYGWYGPHWGGGYSDTSIRYYTQGTLVVDVIDADSNLLVWRATADSRVSRSSTPQENEAQVAEITAQMFAEFPPKK